MRTFEDFAVGDMARMGPMRVGRLEALEFARRYDPEPFLLSDDGTKGHPFFQRMAVSGWLVAALVNRLVVEDLRQNPAAILGTPGVDRLRWLRPVHPNDELVVEAEVVAVRRLPRRPGVGLVRQRVRARNQERRPVLAALLSLLIAAPTRPKVVRTVLDE